MEKLIRPENDLVQYSIAIEIDAESYVAVVAQAAADAVAAAAVDFVAMLEVVVAVVEEYASFEPIKKSIKSTIKKDD